MQPRCLEEVKATLVNETANKDNVRFHTYKVDCPKCGAGAFSLVELSTGDSPTAIGFLCEGCQLRLVPFDGLKHGFDGELGNTEHLTGEPSYEELFWHDGTRKRHDRVFVQFVYNTEQSELDEIAREKNISAIDLFDWFNVIEDDPSSGEVMWEYECA